MNRVVLLLAILAIVLAGNGLAIAQTEENTSPSEAPSQSPAAAEDDPSTLPCGVSLFREEQQQLVQGYPTPVSQRARDCEQLGYVNPYPAPAMVGSDGFVYPYDPIEGQYLYLDPDTGLYYILDPTTGDVSKYDPVSGTYL